MVIVIECALSQGISLYMVKGWRSKRFPRYQAFYEVNGVGNSPACLRGTSWSVLLNESCHKVHEYIYMAKGWGSEGF